MKFLYLLWSGYILYILYAVYDYFKGKHLVSDMSIYNAWFIKKILLALVILGISYALKHFGKVSLAKWVAGIPLIILLIPMIGAGIGFFFYWLGYYLKGSKNNE